MSKEEIFQIVNDLDIPAEMGNNSVNYVEEFDCEGQDHHTIAMNLLETRNKQLEKVGLVILLPELDNQTIRGTISEASCLDSAFIKLI